MLTAQSTRERAFKACDAIFLEHARFPTVDAVAEAIRVNSRRLISEVIKEWRQNLAARFRKDRAEVPEAVRKLWLSALAAAEASLASQRQALEDQRLELESQRLEWQRTLKEQERQIASLRDALDEKAQSIQSLSQKLEQLSAALDQARLACSRLEGQLEEAKVAQQKAEERASGTIEWANLRIEEERTRLEKTWQDKLAKLEIDHSRLRLDVQCAEARQRQAEERLDRVLKQLAERDAALAKSQAEKEALLGKIHALETALARRKRAPLERKSC